MQNINAFQGLTEKSFRMKAVGAIEDVIRWKGPIVRKRQFVSELSENDTVIQKNFTLRLII